MDDYQHMMKKSGKKVSICCSTHGKLHGYLSGTQGKCFELFCLNPVIIVNHRVHLIKIGGPSDYSDRMSTDKSSNNKLHTEIVDCSTTYNLLSDIKSKFSKLAAMMEI